MKIAEKRAAFLVLKDYLERQLAAMPPDDSDLASDAGSSAPRDERPATSAPPFLGRPMTAKFGGKCAVCKGGITVGSPVIYHGGSKQTAHAGCGQDDGGRRG